MRYFANEKSLAKIPDGLDTPENLEKVKRLGMIEVTEDEFKSRLRELQNASKLNDALLKKQKLN